MNHLQRQQLEQSIQDPVKMMVFTDPYVIECGHTFDKDTLESICGMREEYRCPMCRTLFSLGTMKPNYSMRETVRCTQLLLSQLPLESELQEPEPSADISVTDYAPQLDVFSHQGLTCINVLSPDGQNHCPVDLVICIDISSSMADPVIRKDEDGKEIDDGLSTLDIVKHAALALVKGMHPTGRIGITTFSRSAEVVLSMTLMTDQGKSDAEFVIKRLHPNGNTNLWAGIETSLDLCRTINRTTSICLLTDGVPSEQCAPIIGYKNALNRYKDKYPQFNCTLNMIGFGYSLDSQLLDELSQQMNGSYCFVPDGTMVGTIFTHLGANLAVTAGTDSTLLIDFEDPKDLQGIIDSKETGLDACYGWSRSNQTIAINLGAICCGQNRTIVIPTPVSGINGIALRYTDTQTHKNQSVVLDHQCLDNTTDQSKIDIIKTQMFRQILISVIRNALGYMICNDEPTAKQIIANAYGFMQQAGVHSGTECADIMKDLTGEVSEAFANKQAFDRWGKHYTPSLARAHSLQQCNNFRDPGVQHFGGKLFRECRDTIDGLFNTLPEPSRSRARTTGFGTTGFGSNNTLGQTLMSSYNSSSGPCFRGDCMVRLADGSFTRVDQIQGGDRVSPYTGSRPVGTPQCDDTEYKVLVVIKTKCLDGTATFVNYKGLVITPTHPIIHTNDEKVEWCRPIDLVGNTFIERCDFVYNFILTNGHIMNINGIDCVTLGHGFVGNFNIEHPFFGTHQIIDELKSSGIMKTAIRGVITIDDNCMATDPETGWVTGFKDLTSRCGKSSESMWQNLVTGINTAMFGHRD